MTDWQHCAPHASDDALHKKGVDCLRRLALSPAVARLASRHVINVFVSGSNRDNYCNHGEVVCQHELAGLAEAYGPWWHQYAVSGSRASAGQQQQQLQSSSSSEQEEEEHVPFAESATCKLRVRSELVHLWQEHAVPGCLKIMPNVYMALLHHSCCMLSYAVQVEAWREGDSTMNWLWLRCAAAAVTECMLIMTWRQLQLCS
jgi:hypothetical protein